MDKVTLDPDSYSLDFQSDNKTDTICSFYRWGISFENQKFIRDNIDKKKSDMFSFFKETYKDEKLKKQDPRFEPFKAFVSKCWRGTSYKNFEDRQIHEIVNSAVYKKPMEIARDMFPEFGTDQESICQLRGIASSMGALIESFGIEYEGTRGYFTEVIITENDYYPPESDDQVLSRIKKYVPESGFVKSTLDAYQRKCIRFVKSALAATRFLKTINSIRDVTSRKMFEEEFIKAIFDKPDLIPEDINGYIDLCMEYVSLWEITERVNILNRDFRNATDGDDKGAAGIAIRGEINGHLSSAQKANNDCKARIGILSKALAGAREDRMKKEGAKENSLFRYVIKLTTEENRRKLIAAGKDYEKKVLEPEIRKIEGADQDNEGEIHGIDISEILGGFFLSPAEA